MVGGVSKVFFSFELELVSVVPAHSSWVSRLCFIGI